MLNAKHTCTAVAKFPDHAVGSDAASSNSSLALLRDHGPLAFQ